MVGRQGKSYHHVMNIEIAPWIWETSLISVCESLLPTIIFKSYLSKGAFLELPVCESLANCQPPEVGLNSWIKPSKSNENDLVNTARCLWICRFWRKGVFTIQIWWSVSQLFTAAPNKTEQSQKGEKQKHLFHWGNVSLWTARAQRCHCTTCVCLFSSRTTHYKM